MSLALKGQRKRCSKRKRFVLQLELFRGIWQQRRSRIEQRAAQAPHLNMRGTLGL